MQHQFQAAVSAIVPARNEELNIERAVRSIAAQPEIVEIIVVDDQSEDRTGEILQSLANEYRAVRVIRMDDLPAGWLGKPHALAAGARQASGDWLLFTDADTVHRPGSVGELLAHAQKQGADMLSLSPGQKLERWWEKAVIPLVFTELAALYPFEDVSDPGSPAAAANGQYILIRRAAYESVGGHAAAPDAILEDVELARRVKSAGWRLIFLPGAEWVETRMYRSFPEMWAGWTKNLFLLYRSQPDEIRTTIVRMMSDCAPASGLVTLSALLLCMLPENSALRRRFGLSPRWLVVPWLTLLTLVLAQQRKYGRQICRAGFPTRLSKYFVPGALLLTLILLNSVRTYQRTGLVRWKGRTYAVRTRP